jgi:hypothetical protein
MQSTGLHALLWKRELVQLVRKTVGQFLTKLITGFPSHTPGHLPTDLKTCSLKNLHTKVQPSFFHNCQMLKAIEMSFNR